MSEHSISRRQFDAVLLDLDGVVTQTAKVHAIAWKTMFDAYLSARAEATGETFEPFDIATDYRRHVDGKPRYEGVESFLTARDIQLPHGATEDAPDTESICGLGNRKNQLFRQKVKETGVELYHTTIALIRELRSLGFRSLMPPKPSIYQLLAGTPVVTQAERSTTMQD